MVLQHAIDMWKLMLSIVFILWCCSMQSICERIHNTVHDIIPGNTVLHEIDVYNKQNVQKIRQQLSGPKSFLFSLRHSWYKYIQISQFSETKIFTVVIDNQSMGQTLILEILLRNYTIKNTILHEARSQKPGTILSAYWKSILSKIYYDAN